MEYSIGEFSKITNISIYTLRYYEKEGLIVPKRNAKGRRIYSDEDINWIQFIKKLKDTNMSIKEIRDYGYLRAKGDNTLKERMEMLIKHKNYIEMEIKSWKENLDNLKLKINYYKKEIKKIEEDFD